MKAIFSIFGYMGKILSVIRNFIVNLIFFIVLIVVIASLASAPKPKIPNQDALYIAPKGILVDELSYQPSAFDLISDQKQEPETLVRDVIRSIETARDDDRITGIVLNLNGLQGGGISKMNEIGAALDSFRESNKPVVAFSDYFSQQQYYLANFADKIYVNELGAVFITGYGLYRNYFKDATDKLLLKFHVFRAGEYKDAIEPYTQTEMSTASREHNTRWLTELWGRYTGKIESARNLPHGAVDDFITSMPEEFKKHGGSHARFSESAGLVDQALTRIELKDKLIEQFGADKEGKSFASIDMNSYLALNNAASLTRSKNKIGLIVATGTIMDGNQHAGSIGGDSLANLIRQAREDKDIKALVLRIDSGGGSAFASEVIRQELIATREAGLPLYVSMGSVAASGGYWISTPADEIWATPETITGSIGVWGLYPNYSESFKKIGINTDGIATSKIAGGFRGDLPMPEEVQSLLQSSVDNIYNTFLNISADARQLDIEAVHEIAQGRVWTGATAKELGLIDELGSLNEVIAAAAGALNLEDYDVKQIVRPLSTREQIMRSLMEVSVNIGDRFMSAFVSSSLGLDSDNEVLSNISSLLALHGELLHLPDGNHNEVLVQCMNCVAP